MPFSRSTFTAEINEVAIFVFQATRHSEAEEICRQWTAQYLSKLLASGVLQSTAAASVNVRIAHATVQPASTDGVTLVYLVDFVSDATISQSG
jgi:hypothetical protein